MTHSFKEKWQQLAPREQRLIAWGGSLLAAALTYAYVWQPIASERPRLHDALPQLRQDVMQLKQDAAEVQRLRSLKRASAISLPEGLQQAAHEAGLDTQSMQSKHLDAKHALLSLTLTDINPWFVLIGQLHAAGIVLDHASMHAEGKSWRIQCEISLP